MTSLYSVQTILSAIFMAGILLLVGAILRGKFHFLKKIHFPACVVGGILGILLAPQLLGGPIAPFLGIEKEYKEVFYIWKQLPSFFISIVFAGLMLGKSFPSLEKVWEKAAPHIIVGYAMAFSQYIIGILLCLFILVPVFGANPLSSVLIAIGFQGGYGTAAGLGQVYSGFGFDAGYDMAIGMATAGKICAIIVGVALINYAVRFNKMKCPEENRRELLRMAIPYDIAELEYKKQQEEHYLSADTLILHFGVLCVAVVIGWLVREVISQIESIFVLSQEGFVQYIPLFPMALIGGGILQYTLEKVNLSKNINEKHLHSISHSFLDLLIVVAIATISIDVIIQHWITLLILIIGGVLANLLVVFFIAPYFYRNAAWIRAVGDFAHATGSTTTGLLLMKIVDPRDQTGARKDFNYKQPFYEPIVGGGIFTAISLPLFFTFGLWKSLFLLSVLFFSVLIFGVYKISFRKT